MTKNLLFMSLEPPRILLYRPFQKQFSRIMKIKTSTILFFTARDLDEAIAFYKKIPDLKPVTFIMNERRL
jgi:hypothetical protein